MPTLLAMVKFTSQEIQTEYEDQLKSAKDKLQEIKVFSSKEAPSFTALQGWVFEQVIHYCLKQELEDNGLKENISEQVPITGRKKADLGVSDKILIELKVNGLFGVGDFDKYKRYRRIINDDLKKEYLFLGLKETYLKYKPMERELFGNKNTFFIENEEWSLFVERICSILMQ
jgi:hypothetical protein